MPEGHRHLTHEERCQIGALKESGLSDGAIAARLGHDRTSVWRELRRNGGGGRGVQPRGSAGQGGGPPQRGVQGSPKDGARPLGARGGASGGGLEPGAGRGTAASGGWLDGGPPVDIRTRQGRPEGGRHSGRGHIPGRVDISERPEEAGSRERIGDREADTVIGRGHSGAVVSLVDRASGFVFLQRADRRTAAAVSAAMLEMRRPSAAPVHTVTSDNGREFAGHAGVAAELGAAFFLPTPYHSWERGLDGHANGLAPQYLPKGTDLRAVTAAEVRAVRDRTDARPRRALGYRTPAEALHEARPP